MTSDKERVIMSIVNKLAPANYGKLAPQTSALIDDANVDPTLLLLFTRAQHDAVRARLFVDLGVHCIKARSDAGDRLRFALNEVSASVVSAIQTFMTLERVEKMEYDAFCSRVVTKRRICGGVFVIVQTCTAASASGIEPPSDTRDRLFGELTRLSEQRSDETALIEIVTEIMVELARLKDDEPSREFIRGTLVAKRAAFERHCDKRTLFRLQDVVSSLSCGQRGLKDQGTRKDDAVGRWKLHQAPEKVQH